MSAARDQVAMERLYDAAQRRNRAAREVTGWVTEQTKAQRLVANREAPSWSEYVEADHELDRAIYACGTGVK